MDEALRLRESKAIQASLNECSGLQWVRVPEVLCSPMPLKQQSLKLRSNIKEMLHPPVQPNSLKSPPFSQHLDLYVFVGIKQHFLKEKGMPGLF